MIGGGAAENSRKKISRNRRKRSRKRKRNADEVPHENKKLKHNSKNVIILTNQGVTLQVPPFHEIFEKTRGGYL